MTCTATSHQGMIGILYTVYVRDLDTTAPFPDHHCADSGSGCHHLGSNESHYSFTHSDACMHLFTCTHIRLWSYLWTSFYKLRIVFTVMWSPCKCGEKLPCVFKHRQIWLNGAVSSVDRRNSVWSECDSNLEPVNVYCMAQGSKGHFWTAWSTDTD